MRFISTILLTLMLSLSLVGTVSASEEVLLPTTKPPLQAERIIGETLVGSALGVVGFISGGITGAVLAAKFDPNGQFDSSMVGAAYGALIGHTLGTSTGIYLIGNIGDQHGSFLATLAGTITGSALMILLVDETTDLSKHFYILGLPVAGGVVGFNLSRQYEGSHALLQISDQQMALHLPDLSTKVDWQRKVVTYNLNLLQVQF